MKKGANIVLIILLVGLLGALGYFGFQLLKPNDTILVPNFADKSIDEVNTWCNSLDKNPCNITYENSDSVELNKVIYQSINADQELTDSISFIISLGRIETIDIPTIDSKTTRDVIDAWAKENELVNIKFVPETSETVEKDLVIRIEPLVISSKDESITVYISSGKATPDTIEVKVNDYVNLTVEEFEKKAKELGLNPIHAEEKDETSSTVKKGNIVWHGNGSYVKDENFRYGISKGANIITVTKGEYVGLTSDEFKAKVEKLGTKGLKAVHKTDYDTHSSTIEKDLIVYHGNGDYEEQEEIGYGLSLGPDSGAIIVTYGSYIGKTVQELETAASKLGSKGLKPNHNSDRDAYSKSIPKGNVVWHGSGEYDEEEKFNYGISLGKSKEDLENTEIEITQGVYIGKSFEEFKKEVEMLGLVPYHREEWDVKYSSKSTNIIARNGYGTYKVGENISYGLYTGGSNSSGSSEVVVTRGQYVGKTLEEFKKICSDLGIVPEHSEVYSDAYSDTIPKGSLDYHGSGTYVNGEVIHYTLSLGKKGEAPKVTVTSYAGKSETEFKNYISGLKLNLGTRSVTYSDTVASGIIVSNDTGTFTEGSYVNYTISIGKDNRVNVGNYAGKSESEITTFLSSNGLIANRKEANSSSVASGKIISNDTGYFEKGDSVAYTVSLGKAQYAIENLTSYNSLWSYYNLTSYDLMVQELSNNSFKGFTNVTYVKGSSRNYPNPGMIISISVNGSTSYDSGYYDSDVPIVITIAQ